LGIIVQGSDWKSSLRSLSRFGSRGTYRSRTKKLSIQQRIGIRALVFFAGWIVPIRMASEPIGCTWGPALGLKRLRVRGFAERRPGLGFRR
jgi:hypothetical protein